MMNIERPAALWPVTTRRIGLGIRYLRRESTAKPARQPHTCRSTIMRLISAMALAGLRPFGQALAQFMMVWQR